jgi:dihydroorotate dehydrogenase (NAD+) catalytic subunit
MIELTRAGKNSLLVETPVMPAAGTFGFGDSYRDLVNVEKLGAVVTNPVTYQPWNPASGTHVVPLAAGVLMHTGLPNPGIKKVIGKYRGIWEKLPVPLILHIVASSPADIQRCAETADQEESIAALELGLSDDIPVKDVAWAIKAAVDHCEKPVLVRLPLTNVEDIALAAAEAGAGALVAIAPPRGTARDAAGRLIGGRLYGPMVKPLVLRIVGQLARRITDVPIIGAGGIHTAQDARDYIEAGARAVQIDSVTWIQPHMLEWIARDLGGLVLTQPSGALFDEWHPGIGDTERRQQQQQNNQQSKQG